MNTKFNGYMLPFHCDHCGKNFLVAWHSDKKVPQYMTCPFCNFNSADKMYQAIKEEVIIV